MSQPHPVATFRVYLPPGRVSGRRAKRRYGFWEVRIMRTTAELRAHVLDNGFLGGTFKCGPRAAAICRAIHALHRQGGYRPRQRGLRGVVVLALNYMGAGVASHEWTHAAHYEMTTHRGRKSLHLREHEELAWLQGEFVRRFWLAFYRRFKRPQANGDWVAA